MVSRCELKESVCRKERCGETYKHKNVLLVIKINKENLYVAEEVKDKVWFVEAEHCVRLHWMRLEGNNFKFSP